MSDEKRKVVKDGDVEARSLPVALSRDERLERSMELSEKIAAMRALEARRKAAASEFKAEDGELRARADELSEAVKSGREWRDVPCRWLRDDVAGRMELRRTDTMEVIESRPLTAEERQTALVLVMRPAAPANEPGEGA